MAIGSEQRRRLRRPQMEDSFTSEHVDAVLDLLHLTDMAWRDCYGPRELEIPEAVLDDVVLLAEGDLVAMIQLVRQAVLDFRDVRMAADDKRAELRRLENEP